MLVAASAMSPAPEDAGPVERAGGTGAGATGAGATGGGVDPGGGPACGSSAGARAVGGSWLPPAISAVFASGSALGGAASSSSEPDSEGANTVAGSGTEPSSEPALVSVPAQGVAPAGVPAA